MSQSRRFGRVWDSAPQLRQLIVTTIVVIDSVAFAAQLPARTTSNALARRTGSTPERGPTSTLICATALAPRSIAISVTCARSAWQTDSSCTLDPRMLTGVNDDSILKMLPSRAALASRLDVTPCGRARTDRKSSVSDSIADSGGTARASLLWRTLRLCDSAQTARPRECSDFENQSRAPGDAWCRARRVRKQPDRK